MSLSLKSVRASADVAEALAERLYAALIAFVTASIAAWIASPRPPHVHCEQHSHDHHSQDERVLHERLTLLAAQLRQEFRNQEHQYLPVLASGLSLPPLCKV